MFIIAYELNEIVDIRGLSYEQLFLIEQALLNIALNTENDTVRSHAMEVINCIDVFTEGLGKCDSY